MQLVLTARFAFPRHSDMEDYRHSTTPATRVGVLSNEHGVERTETECYSLTETVSALLRSSPPFRCSAFSGRTATSFSVSGVASQRLVSSLVSQLPVSVDAGLSATRVGRRSVRSRSVSRCSVRWRLCSVIGRCCRTIGRCLRTIGRCLRTRTVVSISRCSTVSWRTRLRSRLCSCLRACLTIVIFAS